MVPVVQLLDGAAGGSNFDDGEEGGGEDWQDDWDDHEREGQVGTSTSSANQPNYRSEGNLKEVVFKPVLIACFRRGYHLLIRVSC